MEIILATFMVILAATCLVAAVVMFCALWTWYRELSPKKIRPKKCKWKDTGDECSEYETGCSNVFHNANDGEPITDWASYCPFCGGVISVKNNQTEKPKGERNAQANNRSITTADGRLPAPDRSTKLHAQDRSRSMPAKTGAERAKALRDKERAAGIDRNQTTIKQSSSNHQGRQHENFKSGSTMFKQHRF